ncbi:MAG: response regulator transcription factor [Bacteroidales bacterium]|nr:response regulator transcription factor [Bacteroidales bacterium]
MKCIVLDDDKVSRFLVEKYIKKTVFLEHIGSFSTPLEALNFADIDAVELVFVDIEMPEMSGLDFMKSFKKQPHTIVISAKEKYAVEALNLDAVDYLLKPIEYSRFLKAANKVKERFGSEKSKNDETGVYIKDGNTNLIRIEFNKIVWIEARENYILIVTDQERYTVYFTMRAVESQFPNNQFVRVHRSFIVNLHKIQAIEDNSVVLLYNNSKKIFPLSKTMRDKIINKIKVISK